LGANWASAAAFNKSCITVACKATHVDNAATAHDYLIKFASFDDHFACGKAAATPT
jgi:hypothetical protein